MRLLGSRTTGLLLALALAGALLGALPGPAAAAMPDVSVRLLVTPDPGVEGGQVSETATVTSDGDSEAPGVTILFFLPQGVTASAAGCTALGPFVSCPVGSLAVGASASRTLVFNDVSAGTLEVTASASMQSSGPVTDPTPGDNSVAASTTVNRRPDLQLQLGTAPTPVLVGDDLTVTADVANVGAGPAPDTMLQLVLPEMATIASLPDGCSGDVRRVLCTLGSLVSGSSASRALVLRGLPEGAYSIVGSLTSTAPDYSEGNNRAQAALSVAPRPVAQALTSSRALGALVTGAVAASRCTATRTLRLTLRPQRPMVSAVTIAITGRRARRTTGEPLKRPIAQAGVPARAFVLRVTVELVDGRRLVGQRRIAACPSRRR